MRNTNLIIHKSIKKLKIECWEVSTLNTLSQAFSRKDGPIRNTVISYEKYKPDCSQIHVKVQNIECREVSTLNTLSQAPSCKDVPIRNKVVSYEKYKPNHSQIRIKVEYWMLRCFHSKHVESAAKRFHSEIRLYRMRNTNLIMHKSIKKLNIECWDVSSLNTLS